MIDRAQVRRGRPTVAARLGDEPAIVVGDFYFAKAYAQAALTDSPEVVAILARAVMDICAGEVRQHFGTAVFETVIPRTTRLAEAPSHGKPIIHYDPYSAGAAAYEVLTQEILTRLGF